MNEKPIIKPKFEPEVLEAMRKRGDALDLGRYQLTPSTPPTEPRKEKNGLAKVFLAITSAIAAGAALYTIGENLSNPEPDMPEYRSGIISSPIDMTPAPQRREPLIP